jgi:hypothetical protein
MKKIIMLLVVAALAITVPMAGQAKEDTTNCVTPPGGTNGTNPPAAGGMVQSLAPIDNAGKIYGQQAGSAPAGRIGAQGGHGWVELNGDATTQKGNLDGRNSDSGFSGYVHIDGANSKVCASAGGQKVKLPM